MCTFSIPESPLLVLPSLAAKIGMCEAIILQQINYWLPKSDICINSQNWIWRTYDKWHAELNGLFGITKIKQAIRHLKELGLIIVEQHSSKNWYQANWYTLNPEKIDEIFQELYDLASVEIRPIEVSISDPSNCQECANQPDATNIEGLGAENPIILETTSKRLLQRDYFKEEENPPLSQAPDAINTTATEETEKEIQDVEIEETFNRKEDFHKGKSSAAPLAQNLKIETNDARSEILREIEAAIYDVKLRPWVDETGVNFLPMMCDAIFQANPEYYCLPNKAPNAKKINDRLRSMERSLRAFNDTSIKNWKELWDYWRAAISLTNPEAVDEWKQRERDHERERLKKDMASHGISFDDIKLI